MLNYLQYQHLKRITETQKPYRGTVDKYPFADRNHNYKYFYPKEVNGEIEYHVGYYHRWDTEKLSIEEYEAKKPTMDKKELERWSSRSVWNDKTKQHDLSGYEKYSKSPKTDLIIRSDNTVEIVTDSFHQGMRMIFSAWSYSRGCFQSSVNHGGVIYRRGDKVLPIFKGMRFNMETMEVHPSAQYIITYSRVNRTKSKEALSHYQEKLNMANAFINVMDIDVFEEDKKTVYQELMDKGDSWWDREERIKAVKLADNIFFERPVEACYLYMRTFDVGYYISRSAPSSEWTKKLKSKFAKHIQIRHDTFDKEYVTHLEPFKTSTWNIQIKVNGKMVERLT
jgi:hypothetical protein